MIPLILFMVGLLTDAAWARAVDAVADRRVWRAGFYAGILNAATLATSWFVIESRSALGLLAWAVGGGLGTALAILSSRVR